VHRLGAVGATVRALDAFDFAGVTSTLEGVTEAIRAAVDKAKPRRVGREAETRVVGDLVGGAPGHGPVVPGEPGIGKTMVRGGGR
jgi:dihydroxyacetone kinase